MPARIPAGEGPEHASAACNERARFEVQAAHERPRVDRRRVPLHHQHLRRGEQRLRARAARVGCAAADRIATHTRLDSLREQERPRPWTCLDHLTEHACLRLDKERAALAEKAGALEGALRAAASPSKDGEGADLAPAWQP